MEQAWFPGTHCDVGGGNPSPGLSDVAFLWMLCHAENLGLEFDHAYLQKVAKPGCRAKIYNSSRGLWRLTQKRVRAFGMALDECRDSSLDDRMQYLQADATKRYRRKCRRANSEALQQLTVCPACRHIAVSTESPDQLKPQKPPDPEIEKIHRQVVKDKIERLKQLPQFGIKPKPPRPGSEKEESPEEK